jgi:hypothetical protein
VRRDIFFFAYPVAMTSFAMACGSSTGGGDQADVDASDHVAGDGSAPALDAASSEAHANDATGSDVNDANDATRNDASDAAGNDAGDAASTTGGMPLPAPLYGVTVDDISALSDVVTALGALPHRPTTRIVFDQGEMPPTTRRRCPPFTR